MARIRMLMEKYGGMEDAESGASITVDASGASIKEIRFVGSFAPDFEFEEAGKEAVKELIKS